MSAAAWIVVATIVALALVQVALAMANGRAVRRHEAAMRKLYRTRGR